MTSSPDQRWEYNFVVFGNEAGTDLSLVGGYPAIVNGQPAGLQRLFNAMGEEGWELISGMPLVQPGVEAGTFIYQYVFRRSRRAPPSEGRAAIPREGAALALDAMYRARGLAPVVLRSGSWYVVPEEAPLWGGGESPDANVFLGKLPAGSEVRVLGIVDNLFTMVRTPGGSTAYLHPAALRALAKEWQFPQVVLPGSLFSGLADSVTASFEELLDAVDQVDVAAARLWDEVAVDNDDDLIAQRRSIGVDLKQCQRAADYLVERLTALAGMDARLAELCAALSSSVVGIRDYIRALRELKSKGDEPEVRRRLSVAENSIDHSYVEFRRSIRTHRPGYVATLEIAG